MTRSGPALFTRPVQEGRSRIRRHAAAAEQEMVWDDLCDPRCLGVTIMARRRLR